MPYSEKVGRARRGSRRSSLSKKRWNTPLPRIFCCATKRGKKTPIFLHYSTYARESQGERLMFFMKTGGFSCRASPGKIHRISRGYIAKRQRNSSLIIANFCWIFSKTTAHFVEKIKMLTTAKYYAIIKTMLTCQQSGKEQKWNLSDLISSPCSLMVFTKV